MNREEEIVLVIERVEDTGKMGKRFTAASAEGVKDGQSEDEGKREVGCEREIERDREEGRER